MLKLSGKNSKNKAPKTFALAKTTFAQTRLCVAPVCPKKGLSATRGRPGWVIDYLRQEENSYMTLKSLLKIIKASLIHFL